MSIDVVDRLTANDFRRNYWNPGKPVVIRFLSENWPARRRWTIDYMRERLGESEVPLYKTGEIDPRAPVNAPHTSMRFADYLDLLERGTDLRVFLLNPLRLDASLKDDFSAPDLAGQFIESYPTLFFGAAGSRVFLHYDIDMSHVFHTHFGGRKRVILFSPDDSVSLYKIPFSVRSFMENDPEQIDYRRFPAMRYSTAFEAVLEHGDTLFMPSGWWHHIRYLDTGFALSQRALAHTWGRRAKAANNLFVVRPLETLLRRVAGHRWQHYKNRLAYRRGLRLVQRMEQPH